MTSPYAPSGTLSLTKGRSRDFPRQATNADGTNAINVYLDTDTLAATLWAGDGTAALATPAVAWLSSSAGTYQVSFNNADTASLSPGSYFLETTFTRSGRTGTLGRFAFVLLDAAGTSTGNTLDLVTMAGVQGALAEVLPDDQTFLPTAITAASRAIQRYCRRWFLSRSYTEILAPTPGQWDKGECDVLWLKQYPVIGTPTLKAGWTAALAIQNTATTTNQEAYVGITTSGDPDISLTNTGLSLTAVASGVATVSSVTWTTASPYTTIASVAASINALGNGWQATVQQPSTQNNLGAYNLYGSGAVSAALSPGQTMLGVFASPLASAGVETDTGMVYLAPGAWYGGWGTGAGATAGGLWDWGFGGGVGGGSGNFRPPVLCSYTAGYSVVPEDVQTACYMTIKCILQETQTDTRFQTESADGASVALAGIDERIIPAAARKLLAPWRIHNVR